MSDKELNQLAAKAADKILIEALPEEWRGYREPLRIRISAIIQAAIEKALELARPTMKNHHEKPTR